MSSEKIKSSQTISFRTDSSDGSGSGSGGHNIGIVIEELESDIKSPIKRLAVYSRTPVVASISSGTYEKTNETITKDVIDIVGVNSDSVALSNPKATNVQFGTDGSFLDELGRSISPSFTHDSNSNRVATGDGKEVHGALKISYSYTGDIYKCDLANATLVEGSSKKALFMAHTTSINTVTGETKLHFADNILEYDITGGPGSGSGDSGKLLKVEEIKEELSDVDAPPKPTVKKVAVYAKGSPAVRLSAGSIKGNSDYSVSKVEVITFSGKEANLSHPGIDGAVTLSQVGKFFNAAGEEVSVSFTYDSDTGVIKSTSEKDIFGMIKAEFNIKGKKYDCDIKDAPTTEGTLHECTFFAFMKDADDSVKLSYDNKDAGEAGGPPKPYQASDADKNKDPGALSMKLTEWNRFHPVVNAKDKEVMVFFEIITVPSSLEVILEDIKDVRVCTLQSSSDPNVPYQNRNNTESEAAYIGNASGGTSGAGGGGSTPSKNPEGLLIGPANDLSKIPFYAIPVRKYLNYMNQSTMSLDNLPYRIKLITKGAAWDFFGNPVSIDVKKPGEWVTTATWSYDMQFERMVLESIGEKQQVGPTEIAVVDTWGRLIPVVVQVYVEYEISKAFFVATMSQLEAAKGHDPKKWVPKDAFVYCSGVYKLGIYDKDYMDKRRISGHWICNSQRITQQHVATTNAVSK